MTKVRQLREPALSPFGVRHRTAREAVLASQRGRILEAMVQVVAKKGYATTTIADVVARAGVSRRTFYELFSEKEECFLAAFDAGLEFLMTRISEEVAARAPATWQDHIRIRFETYLETLVAEPEFARVLHIDVQAAGPKARERWAKLLDRLVELYRGVHESARASDPKIGDVSDAALRVLVGGLPEVVRHRLRNGTVDALPALAPELTSLVTMVLSGATTPASSQRQKRAHS